MTQGAYQISEASSARGHALEELLLQEPSLILSLSTASELWLLSVGRGSSPWLTMSFTSVIDLQPTPSPGGHSNPPS